MVYHSECRKFIPLLQREEFGAAFILTFSKINQIDSLYSFSSCFTLFNYYFEQLAIFEYSLNYFTNKKWPLIPALPIGYDFYMSVN